MTGVTQTLNKTPGRPRFINGAGKYFILIALLVLLFIMLFPFFIVAINSFKDPVDYANNGPMSIPQSLYFKGISTFWTRVDFAGKLLNSAIVSITVAVLGVVLSLFNAFALGIGRIKGRIWFLIFFLMANTLPQEALAYPLYYLAKFFNVYNSLIAVIVVFTVIQSAFGTYLLSSVFSQFPREMIDAALIDGCNKLQLLFRIVMPISMPALSVLFVFFFIWTWNEFFLPVILLVSNSRWTVPLAVSILQGQHDMDVTTSSASALLGLLPCIIFFILFQRTLTKGITAGSVK
jgi:raffinose/stachyose/melibiose transport system permease protein